MLLLPAIIVTASSLGNALVIQVPFTPSSLGSEVPAWLFLGPIRTFVLVPLKASSNAPADMSWVITRKLGAAGHSDHTRQRGTREEKKGEDRRPGECREP